MYIGYKYRLLITLIATYLPQKVHFNQNGAGSWLGELFPSAKTNISGFSWPDMQTKVGLLYSTAR